jgi:hypothetical protein
VYELVTVVRASLWLCTRRADATAHGCLRAIDDADRHVDDGVYTEETRRAQVFGDRGLRANGTRRSIMTFSIVSLLRSAATRTWYAARQAIVKAPHEVNPHHLNMRQTNGISIMFSFHAINASRAVTCSCNVHARYKSSCWLNNKKTFSKKLLNQPIP